MNKLKIPHQILEAGSNPAIDLETKVVCISPEKLLDPNVIAEVTKLSWSCICIDEPHLALIWGTSKSKFSKPFREAFGRLSHLNDLSACFEVHSATIIDEDKIFELLGRKNSKWIKQIQIPDRVNLTMYLISGKSAPIDILNLPSVSKAFEDDGGLLLIYVQRISDGSNIHLTLLDFCESNGYVKFCPKEGKPFKPLAFLHSSLSEEAKKKILSDATDKRLRVLIATSSAGSGINIPVTQFIGWGLDPEPSRIIQAMGRTCRKPVTCEGAVIWVHSGKIHGRRIPGSSKVRELLNNDSCLRKTTNAWFCHGFSLNEQSDPLPDVCCSWCMENCLKEKDCKCCSEKLRKYLPSSAHLFNIKEARNNLTGFLINLKINESLSGNNVLYKEESLSEEIIKHIDTTKSVDGVKDFLQIFSLGEQMCSKIYQFIIRELKDSFPSDVDESEVENYSEGSSGDESEVKSDISSEYFDEEIETT